MKAAFLTDIRRFRVAQAPDPTRIGSTDVLIRIATVGVCGSDVHYYRTGRIGTQVIHFPFTIGHEAAGVVEKTGPQVTRVRAGQRVALDPAVSCGHCDQCLAGREHTCRNLLFLGCPGQLEGCLSEYVVLPQKCCFPIPDGMTFEQAALCEPLSVALYTVERSELPPAANVAILGAGPIGMSVFHVLRTQQTGRIYVTDKIPERLALAGRLHPAWHGNPNLTDVVHEIASVERLLLDCVYECSGDIAAIGQALRLLKPGGRLVIVGIPEKEDVTFPIHELRRKEITITNIRRQVRCTQKAIDLLSQRTIDMGSMVTHRFTLDETQAAFDLAEAYGDGVMKAMISVGSYSWGSSKSSEEGPGRMAIRGRADGDEESAIP